MDQDLKDIVVTSISALASVCDHAQTIDGQGFSKSTAGPGHEIAAIGSERWTEEFWDYAARLSAHHSRQLEKGGRLDAEEAERLRQAVRSASVAAPEIQTRWADLADIDGARMVVVSVPSDDRLAAILKNLPEGEVYRPAGSGRLWRVSERWCFAVRPFLGELSLMGEGIEAAVEASWEAATPEDRLIATDLPVVRYDAGRGMFCLPFSYDRDFVSQVRQHGGAFEKGQSWKDCTAYLPADRVGAGFVERMLDGGAAGVLHPEAVGPFEEARSREPSASTLAASQAPRLSFDGPQDGKLRVTMSRYLADFVQAIKSVPGRSYDGGSWLIPATAAAAEVLASRLDGLATAEASEAAADLRRMAPSMGDAGGPAAELLVEDGGGRFVTVTMSQFVREWVDAIRSLPKNDRKFDAETKAWKVRKDEETLSSLLEGLRRETGRPGAPSYARAGAEEIERVLASLDQDAGSGFRM